MSRTQNGLPGIYNATPLMLPDGSGSALAVNNRGELVVAVAIDGSGIDVITSVTETTTNTSIPSVTSTTILAAAATRKCVEVQNNSTTNVLISLSGATLTSAVPSTANPGILLLPGTTYYNNSTTIPVGAITAYQSSGSAIETVSVTQGV